MKGHPQKQFNAERTLIKKTLQSLVQHKHEIRIHFLNNHTCQVQKLEPQENNTPGKSPQQPAKQLKNPSENNIQKETLQKTKAALNRVRLSNCYENLFEVIYRNRNRMESIGWHEETPIRRTSNMSRTFRRKRRSHYEDYQTINDNTQYYDEDSRQKMNKNNNLAVNNLELSGFTNQEILKKSALILKPHEPPKNGRKNDKYPQILTLIGEKNFKRVQFIPPIDKTEKGVFSIASTKINQKWKYQASSEEGSRSTRHMPSPSNEESQVDQKDTLRNHSSNQQHLIEYKKLSPVQREHPFLKQIKPSTRVQKKRTHYKRALSQFLQNRTIQIQQYDSKRPQYPKKEEICRPWSVSRNYDEKIEESKPILQEPLS